MTPVDTDYADRVAVVTGGASGIGAATAALLRSRGATAITFDRQGIDTGPSAAYHVIADLTDHDATARAVAAVGERYGRIDLLVNNAGIGAVDTVDDGDFARWRALFEVNVLGLANMTRAALPFLRRSSHGPAIVNVASLVANVGVRRRASYSATKGAVYALTLAMAADLLDDGIRVNAVAPGTVDTPWVGRLLDAADDRAAERANLERRQPIGRLGTPDEVAAVIAFLGSSAAGFVNAAIWPVDGGMTGLRVDRS
jgi:2-keto-3-deoxy-L-fuconate dehydrogenase